MAKLLGTSTVGGKQIETTEGSQQKVDTATGILSTLTTEHKADLTGAINELEQNANEHKADKANPHAVTKTQVGLGNVDNVQQIPLSEKGAVNGVATLGADGKVPAGQLPPSNATASAISVADVGAYYTSTNAEGALQEIGQTLNAVRGDLITSANSVLGA